jgi:RNA-directed DNA polymerase
MNTAARAPLARGDTLPWKELQRAVCTLQKRIDQATRRGDVGTVRRLQRLWMTSWSAKLLAGRTATQDKQGKRTAGLEGVTALMPAPRLALACAWLLEGKAAPARRVWIPQAGAAALRPLGLPTIDDRARQALAHSALEPAGAARVAPHSDGFRPGRPRHEAIEAMFTALGHKATYGLEADIEKCFDRIAQAA